MRLKIRISESHIGLLYEDAKFVRVLEPGLHKIGRRFRDPVQRLVRYVDMRERSLTIKGQEILTADKVAVRVSLLVYFRVFDPKAALHNVASYEDRIYEDVQLSARRFLASRALDSILTGRNEISDAVRSDVGDAAKSYGVEILRADVKDLVFPGNLRNIMNGVIEAQRRAEAQLIEARRKAEALQISAKAESEADLATAKARAERLRAEAEADKVRALAEIERAEAEAKALTEHPALVRLRELETLRAIASSGAKHRNRSRRGRPDQGLVGQVISRRRSTDRRPFSFC